MKEHSGRVRLILLIVTALCLLVALVFVDPGGVELAERPGLDFEQEGESGVSSITELIAPLFGESGSSGSREVESGARGVQRVLPVGGASLSVRVVDDATGKPVSGILLTLLSERPRTESYGFAFADENGRASFEGLAENMYIVRSMRRLPYAEYTTATWLPDGEHEDMILRLGTGGVLTGRVVDDTGAPLEGVTVLAGSGRTVAYGWNYLSPERIALEERDAVLSDFEGLFRLEAMASEPQGIWVVEGEIRPERFEQAEAIAWLDGGRRSAKAYAKAGETVDVGDIVMPRLRTWRGRVVDDTGAPVPGALVSDNSNRIAFFARNLSVERRAQFTLAPGESGFVLEEDETLANSAGQFELALRRHAYFTVVRARSGQSDRVSLPDIEAGEIREGLELVLELSTLLSIQLLDEGGEPILRAHPEITRQDSRGFGRDVAFQLHKPESADSPEDWESHNAPPSPAGLYRPAFQMRPESMGELLVVAPGYRPVCLQDAIRATRETIPLQLKTLPSIRFSIRADEDWPSKRFPELRRRLELVVSSVRPNADSEPESKHDLLRGLGSERELELGVEPVQAHMFVQESGEYWAYLVPWWGSIDTKFEVLGTFGPFKTSDTSVHEIVVGMEQLERLVTAEVEEPDKLPPPAELVPGEAISDTEDETTGRVLAFLMNSQTGEPASGVGIVLRSGKKRAWLPQFRSNEAGRINHPGIRPGSWRATVTDSKFEDWEGEEFDLEPGGEVDLGTILLVPHPRLVGKLLESDGSPAPRGSSIDLRSAEGEGRAGGATDEEGAFELAIATTERVHANVYTSANSLFARRSLGQFRCTTLTELGSEVELDVWRDVELVVTGLLESERSLRSNLRIDATTCGVDGHHAPMVGHLSPIGPQLDGRRVFRGRIGIGTYIPRSSPHELSILAAPFEVVAGDGLQRVQLSVAR